MNPFDAEVAPLRLSRTALRALYEHLDAADLDSSNDEEALLQDIAAEIAEVLDPAAPTIPVISVHPEVFDAAELDRFTDVTQRVRHDYDELLDEVSAKLDEVEGGSAAEVALHEMFAVLDEARGAATEPYMFMIDVHAARHR